MAQWCEWVLNNPDIVVMLRAIRVEIMVHYVMRHIVPPEDEDPFQFWLRFEFGSSGNPHTHGIAYTVLVSTSLRWRMCGYPGRGMCGACAAPARSCAAHVPLMCGILRARLRACVA